MVVFAVKAGLLRLRRGLTDMGDNRVRRLPQVEHIEGAILSEVETALYTEADPNERALQMGKVQNLRVAARRLDRVAIPADEVFSFWAQIGRPTRAKGFVEGRELRQGCLIPTLGGGLCQMSNSLYQMAKRAGFEIVERHGHTAPIPDSPFQSGEDATVFWNYVDLRFRPPEPVVLSVCLSRETLSVRAVVT